MSSTPVLVMQHNIAEAEEWCPPWPWGSSRTHFQVLGFGLGLVAYVLGLGLVLIGQRNFQWHISISLLTPQRGKFFWFVWRPLYWCRWYNNDGIITASNDRSRPIDHYLVIFQVIMCDRGFQDLWHDRWLCRLDKQCA